MQAARYFCHVFFGLATKVAETESEKIEHLHHKIAKLSSHCAKGNFHQALTDSGLADAVHLQPHHGFFNATHYIHNNSQFIWVLLFFILYGVLYGLKRVFGRKVEVVS
jgi:hypothetical protein